MRGVVVADQVQLQPVRDGGVDELEEPQELLVAVPPVVLGDHRSAGDVQGGEQAGRAVPHVVMGHPRRGRGQDRQAGRGPVQGLDLALLIDREDQGLLGRVEIQADDVADLLDELRVRR